MFTFVNENIARAMEAHDYNGLNDRLWQILTTLEDCIIGDGFSLRHSGAIRAAYDLARSGGRFASLQLSHSGNIVGNLVLQFDNAQVTSAHANNSTL